MLNFYLRVSVACCYVKAFALRCDAVAIIILSLFYLLPLGKECRAQSGEDNPDHATSIPHERVEFGSTPNPVGSGARALGMGGAFISIADDATAASWNPAGLIQLELPEVSIVGAHTSRSDDYSYESYPDASSDQTISGTNLNYLSAAMPFELFNRNMILSLNYQHMYEFDKKVDLTYEERFQSSLAGELIESNRRNYDQEGSLYSISPAFAAQITPRLSVGLTVNFWEDLLVDNEWKSIITIERTNSRGEFSERIYNQYIDTYGFSGINYHAGFLWNLNSLITIGGVFKSPFKADIDHRYERYDMAGDLNLFNWTQSLEMPMSYGIAAAFRVNDVLSFAFDLYHTHWEDYLLKTPSGEEISPVTGMSAHDSDIDPTTQVRLGMEYLKVMEKTVIPFRCGLFYDPEPARNSSDEFWGVSLGSGFLYKKFVFDIAWQYRVGNDVRGVTIGESRTSQDVREHKIYTSLIYHF